MATNIKTLKDVNGDIILPRTRADAITMADGLSNAENEINNKAEKPSILTEAVILANTDLMTLEDAVGLKKISVANMKETFADKAVAQMFKLTAENGHTKAILSDLSTGLALVAGIYLTDMTTVNAPSSFCVVDVKVRTTGEIFQTAYDVSGYVYNRFTLDNGVTFSAWKRIATLENAIIESGSNGNGRYVKFGDGTMICYKLNYYNVSINTDMELAFPAQFLGIDYVANVSPEGNSSIITSINGKGDSSIIVRSNTTNCTLDITIHGRWR